MSHRPWRHAPRRPSTAMLGVLLAVPMLALTVIVATATPSRSGTLLLLLVVFGMVLAIFGNVRRILLGLAIFDVSLQWDKNFDYQTAAAKFGAFAGLNVSATTFALIGLYALFFIDRALGRDRTAFRLGPAVPLFAYIAALVVSIGVATDTTLSVFQIAMIAQSVALFVYVATTAANEEDIRFIAGALIASLVLQSLIVIAFHVTGGAFTLPGVNPQSAVSTTGALDTRAEGTLGSPNSAGAFLSLLIAPALALAIAPVGRSLRLLALTGVGLGTIALVLTFSRGAWIAFALSMLILLTVGWHRGLFRARVPVGIAVGVILCMIPLWPAISQRLHSSDGGAAQSRVPLLGIARNMIEHNPILGVGANNFAVRLPDYATFEARNFLYVVHNRYLLIWAEAGLLGLLAFLWFLGATLRRGVRCSRSRDPALGLLALGITAAFVGHMAHMMFDTFQGRSISQLLCLLAGLLVAIGTVDEGKRRGRLG